MENPHTWGQYCEQRKGFSFTYKVTEMEGGKGSFQIQGDCGLPPPLVILHL